MTPFTVTFVKEFKSEANLYLYITKNWSVTFNLLRLGWATLIAMSLQFSFLNLSYNLKNSFPKFKNTNKKKIISNPISYTVTILDGNPLYSMVTILDDNLLCSTVKILNSNPLCSTVTISNGIPSAS